MVVKVDIYGVEEIFDRNASRYIFRLFSGKKEGSHITTRTLQRIFRNAVKRAKFCHVSLWHKCSKTMEIYTHVSSRSFSKITNPLYLTYVN